MKSIRVRFRSTFEEMDTPPSGLPTDEDGRAIPLELATLGQFHECHYEPPGEPPSCPINDGLTARVELPSLEQPDHSIERFTESLLFDASRPARYFRCITQLDESHCLESRFVHRAGADFIVTASYVLSAPGPNQPDPPANCYYFGTVPCDPSSAEPAAKATARQRLDDLLHLRCGPARPHFGNELPLLGSSKTELGDGAFAWEFDPKNGTTTITIRNAMLDALPRKEKRRVREELGTLLRRLRLPTGGLHRHRPGVLRNALARLTPICEDLVVELADGEWPPFGSHRAVDHFVQDRFSGDRKMMKALADTLKAPQRRPSSGRQLAMRVLVTAAELDRRSIARAISGVIPPRTRAT